MTVIDASAMIELLLRSRKGRLVLERVAHEEEDLHAPEVLDLEVLQVVRRLELAGVVSPRRAAEALQDLGDLAIARYPHRPHVVRMWSLRGNLSAYDAAYVALAEALEAPLLTCDGRLARAPGNEAVIELVG